jgi:uncharacterized protein YgbK (DUF1537 family)
MPDDLFHAAAPAEELIAAWCDQLCSPQHVCGTMVLTVDHPPAPQKAAPVRACIAATVARLLSLRRPDALWMEGGATAAAVVDAMGWRQFDVEGTLSPGVVALRAVEPQRHRLIVKPGSYAWPRGVL